MSFEENKNSTEDIYVIPCEYSEKLKKAASSSLDKEILRFKIIFFLHNGGLAAAFFYIAIIAKEHVGLSSSSLGAVLTVQMFLFTVTKPLIGYISDFFNSLKITICVLTLLNLACFFSLFTIPKINRYEIANSPAIFEEMLCNTTNLCDLCKDSRLLSQNASNPTVIDSTNLNLTENGVEEFQSCLLCYSKDLNCSHTSEEHFMINTSIKTISNFNEDSYHQNCKLFCNGKDSFNANFHSSLRTFCQNVTNCTELLCSQNLNLNEIELNRKDGTFSQCPEIVRNLQRTLLIFNRSENSSKDMKLDSKEISDFYTYQFWMFAILFTISNICENANFTLVDTACCESIEKSKADFGKLRLWGNVGWGLFSPIGGLLNDYTGSFFASTALMAVLLLSFLYNIIQLDLVKPHYSNAIIRDIGTVFRSKEFLFFELVNLMNGIGTGIIWFYLSWFVTSLGGSKLLSGLSVAVQSFGGVIPLMFFSGWIIRKVGYCKILSFTLIVFGLRFLLYSQLYNPWWILPIELTHGITYGLYYTALATYGKLKAQPGTEATIQSILFTTHEGLGAGIGCGFAGIGFDYFGTHQTFFYLSAYFGCDFLFSLLLYFFFVRKPRKNFTINSKL